MINNLTTIDVVISKIVSMLDIQESINEDEWIEWIIDAYRFIGSANQLVDKDDVLCVKNYKAKFPCGFYGLKYVDSCLKPTYYQDYNYQGIFWFFSNPHSYQTIIEKYNNLSFDNSIFEYHVFDRSLNLFKVKHNIITTSFQEGLLKVYYTTLPKDERGIPYVADDESYQTAFMWYVAKYLVIRKQIKAFDFDYCHKQWLKYCLQARGNANLPDNYQQNETAYAYNKLPAYNNVNGRRVA